MEDGSNIVTKVELAVNLSEQKCVVEVTERLNKVGSKILSLETDLEKQKVTIESSLPSHELVDIVESTGRHKAIVTGIGESGDKNLGCAVAIMHEGNPASGIRGVARVVQNSTDTCLIDGTLDGLSPNHQYRLGVHYFGDLRSGCDSCEDLMLEAPGSKYDPKRCPYGAITTINSDGNGRSSFRVSNSQIKVWEIIGRSMVLSRMVDSSSWIRQACGVIARSAGIFENPKRICACDGVTIWEERDVPLAGAGRNAKTSSQL